MILPILEESSIMYTNFAFLRTKRRRSASTCAPHEKPLSGVNAEAEMIASSKFVSAKYCAARGEAVDKLSLIKSPPRRFTVTFFFCASSCATAMPFVNTLHFISGSSFAKYSAVVPPSMKMEVPSSTSMAAFCAMAIFSSVCSAVFFTYGSPEVFCTSFTESAPPRMRMIFPSSSS